MRRKISRRSVKKKKETFCLTSLEVLCLVQCLNGSKMDDDHKNQIEVIKGKMSDYINRRLK